MVQGTLLGALGWPMWEGIDFCVVWLTLEAGKTLKINYTPVKKKIKIKKTKTNHKSNIPSEFLPPSWVIQSALSWPQAFPAHTHTLPFPSNQAYSSLDKAETLFLELWGKGGAKHIEGKRKE